MMATTYPIFSLDDTLNPYIEYRARAVFDIDAGSAQLPLAYKTAPVGQTLPTARLLQVAQPLSVLRVEWMGVRRGAKPQAPIVTIPGTFVLASAGATIDNVGISTDGREEVAASGYLILYTNVRPENIVMPSLLAPWDGRYGNGTINFAYSYTPTDLGFGQLLPGIPANAGAAGVINNPPAQNGNAGKLFL